MLRTVPPLGCISVGFLLNLLNDALLGFGLLVSPWPFFKNYFWLPWLCCYVQASHCRGFSCCRAWAVGCTGSVAVVQGLSCSTACVISLDKGSNLCPLHWQADS